MGLELGDPAPGEQVDRGGAAVVLRLQHLVGVRARVGVGVEGEGEGEGEGGG